MNASANSQEISDIIICATCYSPSKGLIKLTKEELEFEYRNSRCQRENLIVLQAEFELSEKPKEEIKQKMEENLKFRRTHQPSLALPNCGSIFKNPPNNSAGRLLESIGAKQMRIGGVKVWENHANFIVNDNNGTSTDVLSLMYKMYTAVEKEYNIKVNYGTYSSNEELLAKISSSKEGTYDLIFPSDYMVEVLKERNLVEILDKSKLNNISNINPLFLNQNLNLIK